MPAQGSRHGPVGEQEGIGEEDSGVVQSDYDDDDHKRQFASAGLYADGKQRVKEKDWLGIRDMKREAGREMATRCKHVGYFGGTGDHGGPQELECEPDQLGDAAIADCLKHPDMRQQDGADAECSSGRPYVGPNYNAGRQCQSSALPAAKGVAGDAECGRAGADRCDKSCAEHQWSVELINDARPSLGRKGTILLP